MVKFNINPALLSGLEDDLFRMLRMKGQDGNLSIHGELLRYLLT